MPNARFDADRLIEEFGDEGLLADLAVLLLDQAELQLAAVHQAIASGDAAALRAAAHKIKGGLGSFGADAITRPAEALEALARAGTLTGAAPLAETLAAEVNSLCDGARAWLSTHAA